MATVTRYFRTDASAGGDGTTDTTSGGNHAYQSMNAAITSEATNLVTAGNILHLICTTEGVDTTAVAAADFSGYTVDASNYIIIEATGSARCNGVSREKDGTGYQLRRTGDAFKSGVDYLYVKGIEFTTTGESYEPCESTGGSGHYYDECMFTVTSATASSSGAFAATGSAVVHLTNCLAIGNSAMRAMRLLEAGSGTTVDHCGGASGNAYAILPDDACTITNTWAYGSSSEDFYTGATAASGSHNASEDATAATDFTNTVTNFTAADVFTSPSLDPSTADFTLKTGSSLIAAGTGSEAVDITGASRTGTADIGPFNYDAGGSSIPVFSHHYTKNID